MTVSRDKSLEEELATVHPGVVRSGPCCTAWSHACGDTAGPPGSSEVNKENGSSWTVAVCAGAAAAWEFEAAS